MKRAAIVLLGACALGALVVEGGWTPWFGRAHGPRPLILSGTIEAHESLVSFKVPGRIVELPVEEGQSVQCDQLLARIDDDDYRQALALDHAATTVRHSQLALGLAGSRPQDIEAARQATVDAAADLDQKRKDFTRYEALFEKDEVTGQLRDQAATNVTRAQAAYDRAKQVYDAVLEGTRKEELAVEHAAEQQAREAERLSKVRLEYTRLVAPFDGVVVVRQAELGEVVAPGAPIVSIADLAHVWVRAYLPEQNLGRVHWGQQVRVRTDSYPGKTYEGHISFISPDAEFTPKTVQTQEERVTLVYRVKVDIVNDNFELKPGMPADAVIDVQ